MDLEALTEKKMEEFVCWLSSSSTLHPVELAAEAHYRLVTMHPFVDGNGRTARLLMNMILLMSGYPAAIIRKRDRLPYLGALEKSQLGESHSTIRHWTKKGLLNVAEVTEAGYQLYGTEAVERIKKIHELKKQRLTLDEIKKALDQDDF